MNMETENKDNISEAVTNEDPSHVCKVDRKRNIIDGIDGIDAENGALSKRPWSLGSKEVSFAMPDGTTKSCWIAAVLDANGDTVCFGKTADMKFIVETENAIPKIEKVLESNKDAVEDALKTLCDFVKSSNENAI